MGIMGGAVIVNGKVGDEALSGVGGGKLPPGRAKPPPAIRAAKTPHDFLAWRASFRTSAASTAFPELRSAGHPVRRVGGQGNFCAARRARPPNALKRSSASLGRVSPAR